MKKTIQLFAVFMLMLSFSTVAQNKVPLLEKNITVRLNSVKMDAALAQIGAQGGFTFSYNTALIDLNRTVDYTFNKKTIREIIQVLFNGKIEGKARGMHIILVKAKIPEPQSKKDDVFKVSGYIESSKGEKIPWVSIYNKKSMSSAVSDNYGFYTIELPKELNDLSLNVSKKDFVDTIVRLPDNNTQFMNITLTAVPVDTTPKVDVEKLYNQAEETSHSFFMSPSDIANEENIKDTIYRKWQVAVIPFVGTNGALSGSVINDYSFNVFGGYSMGTRKLEAAGIFNVNRSDVEKCQLAGVANAVGGNVNGCQLAGSVNAVMKDVDGLQAAGFVNVVGGNTTGCQLAGFVNTVRKNMDGVQMAGYVNLVLGSNKGAQFAGFVNTTRGKSDAFQMAGFVNAVFDTSSGFQMAGFVNYAHKDFTGTQFSGIANVALYNIKGSQISFFNYAKNLKGAQVGIFNYSKSCTGIPVGFISYVDSGYHQFEVSADELFYANVAFRTGVTEFHNIITAGIRPDNFSKPLWTFGYGIGSTVALGKKVNLDIDITSSQVVKGGNFDKMNLINRGYIGADIKLSKKYSLAFGGTVNAQIYDADYEFYPQLFSDVQPNIFYESSLDAERLQLKMWLGGKVALRFL